ncbi:MAG: hypothetical protein L0154_01755 [Chloroflexi bacterium]|nr:hypothetical protein [Chloroflexota bacterium]
MTFKRNELIVASEVARYVYCQRAWWYDHKIRSRRRKRLFPLLFVIPGLMIITSLLLIFLGIQ